MLQKLVTLHIDLLRRRLRLIVPLLALVPLIVSLVGIRRCIRIIALRQGQKIFVAKACKTNLLALRGSFSHKK